MLEFDSYVYCVLGVFFIQLNTNKQQQPVVIKAITAATANRQQLQQQPILLTTNTQSKTILPQNQPQVLVFNQGQQQKFTLKIPTKNHSQTESTTDNNNMPQLDGTVD